MKINFSRCPDCGNVYGEYGNGKMPELERRLSVDYDDNLVTKNVVKAVCGRCGWETKYHDNVGQCAEEWNSTALYPEHTIKNDFKYTSEEKHIADRLAGDVMKEIFAQDKTGRLLYLFVQCLRNVSRLYAYRAALDPQYNFVVITADEYEELKRRQ